MQSVLDGTVTDILVVEGMTMFVAYQPLLALGYQLAFRITEATTAQLKHLLQSLSILRTCHPSRMSIDW